MEEDITGDFMEEVAFERVLKGGRLLTWGVWGWVKNILGRGRKKIKAWQGLSVHFCLHQGLCEGD